MTHTNPNHLLKHVFQHSAQWCVKTNYPVQSEGALGGSSQAGGRDQDIRETLAEMSKTSSHSNLRFRESGRGRRWGEGGDGECEPVCVCKGGRGMRLWTVMLPLVARRNPIQATWGSLEIGGSLTFNTVLAPKSWLFLKVSVVMFALYCYIGNSHLPIINPQLSRQHSWPS